MGMSPAHSREEGEMVIHLRTLRRVNGVPMSVIDHYRPIWTGGRRCSSSTAVHCTSLSNSTCSSR